MFPLAFANEVSSIANERLNTIELFGKMYSLVEVKYVYKDTRMIDISRHIVDIVSILKFIVSLMKFATIRKPPRDAWHVSTESIRQSAGICYRDRVIGLNRTYTKGREGIICQIEFRQAILVN